MFKFLIQLFADGGVGGASAGDGVASASQSDVAGEQNDDSTSKATKSFDDFLNENPEYAKEHKGRIEKAVKSRLKNTKDNEATIKSLEPLIKYGAVKFGVGLNDYDKLSKAASDGLESLYEEQSLESGTDVEDLKAKSEERFQNDQLKQKIREYEAREWLASMQPMIQEAQNRYPDFNFEAESQNEDFTYFVNKGKSLLQAYESVHHDEIMSRMVKATAEDIVKKTVNSVASNSNRPKENGISSNATATTKVSPKNMTRAERKELIERAKRGEIIILD